MQETYRGPAAVKQYLADCLASGEPVEFNTVRKRAAERFASKAWPSAKDEEWRRSRVEGFEFDKLVQVRPRWYQAGETVHGIKGCADGSSDAAELVSRAHTFLAQPTDIWNEGAVERPALSELGAVVAVRADGLSAPVYSLKPSAAAAKGGLVVAPLTALAPACSGTVGVPFAHTLQQRVAGILGAAAERSEKQDDDRFLSWNLAAWNAGLVVYAPKNAAIAGPVVIDWEFSGDDAVHQPLLVVVAENGAELTVIQRFHGAGGYLVNQSSYASVGDNAGLGLFSLQETGREAVFIGHSHALVGHSGRFKQSEAQLGSGFAKTRATSDISGSGSEVHLDGLYFGEDEQHFDLRTVQNHLAPDSNSRAFYKGVVRDRAKTVYQGLILVEQVARGTDAFLTNRNMVLDDGARADSIPTLEIRTNDVKCSHGSTTGKIDPEEIYYLENRGLSRAESEKLVIVAYLDEVTGNIPALVREHVRAVIAARVEKSA
jgi:Fe-S cluster assembly protein SufD